MTRKAFFSFYYPQDSHRASQVRNIGAVEKNPRVSDNTWEQIRQSGGDAAIKRWINNQMKGRSVVIVLIGEETAQRKYVKYEIEKGWNDGKGVLGIHIYNLKNLAGEQSSKGSNPFRGFTVEGRSLSSIVKTYEPPYSTSKKVYEHIGNNLEEWVEQAISIRNGHS